MAKLSTFLLVLFTVSTTALSAFAESDSLIKNGDAYSFDSSGSESNYTFERYQVKTFAGDEGDQIVVHFENGDTFEFCEVDMNTYFYGIHEDVMFVLSRGGLFPTLMGFHLVDLDMEPYEEFVIPEGGAAIDGSKLIVWRVQEGVAPEVKEAFEEKAEQLEADDHMVFYARKVIYDYESKTLTETDDYDCVGTNY